MGAVDFRVPRTNAVVGHRVRVSSTGFADRVEGVARSLEPGNLTVKLRGSGRLVDIQVQSVRQLEVFTGRERFRKNKKAMLIGWGAGTLLGSLDSRG